MARFETTIKELKQLEVAQNELVIRCAAQASDLHVTTLSWRTRVQIDLPGLASEDIAITETKAAEVVLLNARRMIEVLEGQDTGAPDATGARTELEAKHSSMKAAFEALQAGRVAVQDTQRELRVLAAVVHQELVKLRKTVRLVRGSTHADAQYLRIDRSRAAAEPPNEEDTATEPTSTEGEPLSTAPSNGSSVTAD